MDELILREKVVAIKWMGGGRHGDWRYAIRWTCPDCGRSNWMKNVTTTQEDEPKTLELTCQCGAEHIVGPYIHTKSYVENASYQRIL